jgi:serine/threonine protein kinase
LPREWACEVVRQTCFGLTHAHERGLVHRDVKPSNLLVIADDFSQRPMVKILDFGLVRLVGETWAERNLTAADQVLGTPDYIAPEQAYDPRAADVRSDIYSLGCTLFQMLTGQVPFQGKTPVEKLMARAGRQAPRVRSLVPDVALELDELVAKMLAHDPAKRYQTPAEVASALAPFAYRRPLSGLSLQKAAEAAAKAAGAQTPATRSAPATAAPKAAEQAPVEPAVSAPATDATHTDSGVSWLKLLLVVLIVGGVFGAAVILSAWK